jgi:hypothetical protein
MILKGGNKMSVKVYGWDDGYADQKGFDGRDTYLMPSFATRKGVELPEGFGDAGEPEQFDHVVVEYENTYGKLMRVLVGKGALQQDLNGNINKDNNKHDDPLFPATIKALLGSMTPDSESVKMGTVSFGLPVETFKDESRKEQIKKAVAKRHLFKISFADGTVYDKDITIEEVLFTKQPMASLLHLILNENGEIANEKLAQEFNVVVDIGGGTINILVIDKLKEVTELTTHTNDGMHTAYDNIGAELATDHDIKLKGAALMKAITIDKQVQGIDLAPYINTEYEIHAGEVKKIVKSKLNGIWGNVKNIIFTGGGTEALKEWLIPLFENDKEVNAEIHVLDRFATAKGLYKLGVRHNVRAKGRKVTRKQGGGIKIEVDSAEKEIAAAEEGE